MKHIPNHYLFIILLFLSEFIFAQKEKLSGYYLIQRHYVNRAENDSTALPLIAKVIRKAKAEKNYLQLQQGYNDALFYSPNPTIKLKYADSTIYAAHKLNDDKVLAKAYMSKGIVYFYNFKKYRLALTEFLKANDKSCHSKDPYARNKIKYWIAVVRSYIGYHEESLKGFKETTAFFEREIEKDMHPNLMYNNLMGYYNSLHQLAICYRHLKNYKVADSVIAIGISATYKNPDYKLEYSSFLKEKGINNYINKNYKEAISSLSASLPELKNVNDFGWAAAVYSYLGNSQLELGHIENAIYSFNKVDSIFNKQNFLLPEVRNVYETLITHYGKLNNTERTLYYTKQLLKLDKRLEEDFIYLSSNIHQNYDSKKLLKEKSMLERNGLYGAILVTVLSLLLIIVGVYNVKIKSKERSVSVLSENKSGEVIEEEIQSSTFRIRQINKLEIQTKIVNDILQKLEEFENNRDFLQSGVIVQKVAEKFQTSPTNLSYVINEYKGASFNRYVSELRINYITDKLNTDPKYLRYSMEALAEECGIASRTNFSNLFHEINGIRPVDYIKKKLEDLQ
ncbi:hypothetical protein DRF65_13800 [Chryseobacterium pennae]|uniref:HTH araC/xylS-type domain-containing protein n=1 Tax=Chryseobacterium pennae TaxID=2258962 RepID=A0A3D9C7C7_9FLAO|nr:helix-turn-helix domain-containing protein [Chryseobacterium pennae]REC61807.1 hypothetical protein DRF65_13800 [Chryseobacterium pennae]